MNHRGNRFRIALCLIFLGFLIMGSITSIAFSKNSPQGHLNLNAPHASSVFDKYVDLVWNRTYPNPCMGGSIWGEDEYIYSISTKGHLWGTWKYVLLTKWDKQGRVIWEKEWGETLNDMGVDIWGDETYIYTCGSSISDFSATENASLIFLLNKWDKDGNQLWNKTWNSGFEDYFHRIWGDEEYLYLLGSSTNFTYSVPYPLLSNISLLKLNFEGNLVWNRTWEWNNLFYHIGHSIEGAHIDSIRGLDLWGDEEYLYCLHSEGLRLMKWHKNGALIWNKTFDGFDGSVLLSICGDSNYLYTGGYSGIAKIDKEGNMILGIDAGNHMIEDITTDGEYLYCTGGMYFPDPDYHWYYALSFQKWDVQGNLKVNTTWFPYKSSLYLGEESIWMDGKDVYTSGEFWYGDEKFLVKWNVTPPYFLYFGVPPIAVLAIGAVLWYWIKPVYRYKRKKLAKELVTVQGVLQDSNYQQGLRNLDEVLPAVEEIKDPELMKSWELMRKKCDIDMHFIEHLNEQKQIIEKGEFQIAYDKLVELLKLANSEAYVGFVDKRIVSDITDILKSVSESIN